MSSLQIPGFLRHPFFWVAAIIALASIMTATVSFGSLNGTSLQGRVLRTETQAKIPWRTFEDFEVSSGATIPANTNVVFHLPLHVKRITRKVLFGDGGDAIRYWGYCFPDDEDPKNPVHTSGFPGKLFLSEAERRERENARQKLFPKYTIFRPPTSKELKAQASASASRIRHQQEIFFGGRTCYIQTEAPLPLGTDDDEDLLNSAREKEERTDPSNDDTDGDGLLDGLEVALETDPLRRDSDSDGLIDGIEDQNRNGRLDFGETSALARDTDHDGLCDGYCRVVRGGRICNEFTTTKDCIPGIKVQWRGEDKNLNGTMDAGETNPLTIDTDKDGVTDEQEYFNCLLAKKTDC